MSRTGGLYTAAQRQVINQMLKLASSDDKGKIVRAFNLAEKITPDQYKGSVRFVADKIEDDHPALLIAKHVTSKLSPRCRDAFIECLIVNTLLRGVDKRKKLIENTGNSAPTTILMSPTMRCNLTCEGCYASEYNIKQDLDRSLMQKIVDEGNDMGVYLFTLLGGEPFMWDELLDFAQENKDAYFQVFTNGTLLDHDTIDELAKIGNIAPMLSLEGSPELTDQRRGEGVHDQVMEIMDHLGEAGVLFGYSCTVTRNTWQAIVSDDFVDPLIAKGALLGVALPLHAGGSRPRHEHDAHGGGAEPVPRRHPPHPRHQGALPGRFLGRRPVGQRLHRRQALHAHQQRRLGGAVHLHALRHRQRPRRESHGGVQLGLLP